MHRPKTTAASSFTATAPAALPQVVLLQGYSLFPPDGALPIVPDAKDQIPWQKPNGNFGRRRNGKRGGKSRRQPARAAHGEHRNRHRQQKENCRIGNAETPRNSAVKREVFAFLLKFNFPFT